MPAKRSPNPPRPVRTRAGEPKPASPEPPLSTAQRAEAAVAWLRRTGTRAVRDSMARYAIPSDRAFGVSMTNIQVLAKSLGRDHALAAALWATGWYEARMLTAYVDEPERVTSAQMDRWAREFDSWAIGDTLTFCLWDRTPHAWKKVDQWAARPEEFIRRSAFAMLASLTVHDKLSGDEPFRRSLVLVERHAGDERNFVMKAVNWALRSIGKRSPALNREAIAVAERLAARPEKAPRWIGKHALRELRSPGVARRLAKKRSATR